MSYEQVCIKELFTPTSGRPRFIRDYMDANPGDHPVYSASLTKPFGFVNEFEYEGVYLTWVMNGYGGRVQELRGRFSANRDRGVLIPKAGVRTPDLTFLRFAMEPQLTAAAVGRRVDGRLNEYTKLYPEEAGEVVLQLPSLPSGKLDFERMARVGARLRKVEAAQSRVREAYGPLASAEFAVSIPEPNVTLNVGDARYFRMSIGKRVLRSEHVLDGGIPAYSANAIVPFGRVGNSNLIDFDQPSLLWGIDGNFDWNLLHAGVVFATTDHCGRLQTISSEIDPEFLFWFLKLTRSRYGYDRVYRASLHNVAADVTVTIPTTSDGNFDFAAQRRLAAAYTGRQSARKASMLALEDVIKARVSTITYCDG